MSTARRPDRKRDALMLPTAGQAQAGCQPKKPWQKVAGSNPRHQHATQWVGTTGFKAYAKLAPPEACRPKPESSIVSMMPKAE